MPRLVLLTRTTTTPAIAMTAIFSRVMLSGGATSPLTRRRRSRMYSSTPARATSTMVTIQLAVELSAPASMSFSTLLCSRITPPLPMSPVALISTSRTPDRPRKPASVTTKDGNRNRVMMKPCSAP